MHVLKGFTQRHLRAQSPEDKLASACQHQTQNAPSWPVMVHFFTDNSLLVFEKKFEESHGQSSLAGYNVRKELNMTEAT